MDQIFINMISSILYVVFNIILIVIASIAYKKRIPLSNLLLIVSIINIVLPILRRILLNFDYKYLIITANIETIFYIIFGVVLIIGISKIKKSILIKKIV